MSGLTRVPTGDTSESLQAYYHTLYSHRLDPTGGVTWEWLSLQNNLRFILLWFGWLLVMAVVLYWLNRREGRTRWRNDLYPAEEYNGYLQEHVGPIGVLKWILFGVGAWVLAIIVEQLLQGQVY